MPVLAVIAVLVAALAWFAYQPRLRWALRKLPGPPSPPIVGVLPNIVRMGGPKFFMQCKAQYGSIFKVWFGRSANIVVADAELVKQAGSKLLNRGPLFPISVGYHRKVENSGLLSAMDGEWRLVRSAWAPAFAPNSLAGYVSHMRTCAEQLCDRLAHVAKQGQRVDIWRELGSMTLAVVGTTAYGVDFKTIEPPPASAGDGGSDAGRDATAAAAAAAAAGKKDAKDAAKEGAEGYGEKLVQACKDWFEFTSIARGSRYGRVGLVLPELKPLVARLAYALPDNGMRRLMQARDSLIGTGLQLMRAWQEQHAGAKDKSDGAAGAADNKASSAAAAAGGGVSPGSFLGCLLAARDRATGEALADHQIVAQAHTFIVTGYETTANAIAFAIYCIASHPEVEAKLLAEIDAFGRGREVTAEDVAAGTFPYAEAVFNEGLRLYPTAPGTVRQVGKEPLQLGGYTLPPGRTVMLSIYAVHHDPAAWPQPEAFIPERHLPASPLHADVCARLPNAFIPFGVGSRLCVGWKFALQEAKICLVRLYQRFSFGLEPGQVPLALAYGISMCPKHGVWVKVHERP